MKVKDKEKLNNPLEGWRNLSAISSMVFHTVHCVKNHKKLHSEFALRIKNIQNSLEQSIWKDVKVRGGLTLE